MSSKSGKKKGARKSAGGGKSKGPKIKVTDSGEAKPATGKTVKAPRVKKEKPEKAPKRVSLIDAAARILVEAGAPMKVAELYAQVEASGLWTPGAGKTPMATLSASIIREIRTKGAEARFAKVGRGEFAAGKGAR